MDRTAISRIDIGFFMAPTYISLYIGSMSFGLTRHIDRSSGAWGVLEVTTGATWVCVCMYICMYI